MNKRVKRLWLKALRSGEYKQAVTALRTGSGRSARFCCLGVLCELHRLHSADPGRWRNAAYYGDSATLPAEVQQWAEIDDDNPVVTGERDTLAGLNDGGKDFIYIADVIEKYL